MSRWSLVCIACVAAGIAMPGAAMARISGPTPIVLDTGSVCGPQFGAQCVPAPAAVAFGGWSAWSRIDEQGSGFELVIRSPGGRISAPAIPTRAAPFDVELGPSGSRVVAVYSRCANTVSDEGCAIDELPLGVANAAARQLDVPGGGSLHEPAIWNGTLVFLRRNAGGDEDVYSPRGTRPDSLLAWQIGTRKVEPLALPQSRGVDDSKTATYWPKGVTGVISGLTLDQSSVAYTTAEASGAFAMSSLWTQPLGGQPRLTDQVTAGQGNVCDPMFLSPVISGGWLYAYLHACPAGGGPISDDRFTRYGLGAPTAQRAEFNFIHYIDDQIYSVEPDGRGAIWDNGRVELLPTIVWKSIVRPVPETLCTRSDPFC